MDEYPTLRWVRKKLRNNLVTSRRYKILDAYIIGSYAKGEQGDDSDLDIAVVIPPVRGKSSLQVSEEYHALFKSNRFKPHWRGVVVDIQYFYLGDPELESYDKIPLDKPDPYLCLGCKVRWKEPELDPLPGDWEDRVNPLDPVPHGACPDCGEIVWHDSIRYL